MAAYRKTQPYISLANSYLIDSPQPSSINYWYNLGSLLGLCLVIQIASGIFLAMHYSSHIELAFDSVEHIMRDVNYGWLIRYLHATGASFFFVCIYLHIGKAIYYGSYRKPRTLVWVIGVIILIATMATGFLGYCLVYGQMSHWGKKLIVASNIFRLYSTYIIQNKCLYRKDINNYNGPLNKNILSIIYGSLLGDGFAEKRKGGKGTRICFYQEGSHTDYLLYLHSLIANLGYCNTKLPKISTRLGKQGKIRSIIRFNTWTYESFNWIYNEWYDNKIKRIPLSLKDYFTPLTLAIWIMDDGCKSGKGLKLSTNSFKYNELLFLIKLFYDKYDIKVSIVKTGVYNQYDLYIWKESIPKLFNLVKPYIIPSMKYKINI